jgi:AcrR family transcriptional regulator
MGRWEPNASGRLREAALALYVEQGYEQTTVAEIAERAGLTARTFFRYYADKREVLFAGASQLQEHMVQAVGDAPAEASPMDAVAAALGAAAFFLGGHRAQSARRQQVIVANAELQERELIKMASLANGLAAALRERGVPGSDARLAAEAGITVLRVAFEQWLGERKDRALGPIMDEVLEQLRSVTAAP